VVVVVQQLEALGAEQTGDLVTARVAAGHVCGSKAALRRRVLEIGSWRASPTDGSAGAN
jgi:hypothetical protein